MDYKTLEQFDDTQLTAIAVRCEEIKKRRKEELQARTLREIAAKEAEHEAWKRAQREAAGLPLEDEKPKGKRAKKPKKESPYKSGHIYQHPETKQEWNGHGKAPSWVGELEAKGLKPIDKGIQPQLAQEMRKVG
jgi:DNA-binding protein H-NS